MFRIRMPNGRLMLTDEILMVNADNGIFHTANKEDANAVALKTNTGCYLIQCKSQNRYGLIATYNQQLCMNGHTKFSHHDFEAMPLSEEVYKTLADQTDDI